MKVNPVVVLRDTQKLLADLKAFNKSDSQTPDVEDQLHSRCRIQISSAFGEKSPMANELTHYLKLSPWTVTGVLAERLEGFVEAVLIPALVALVDSEDNTVKYLKTALYVLTLVLVSIGNYYCWNQGYYTFPIAGFIEFGLMVFFSYIFYLKVSGHIFNLASIISMVLGLIFAYLSVREYLEI